jgi:uncharacterized protein (TIGR03437 family)
MQLRGAILPSLLALAAISTFPDTPPVIAVTGGLQTGATTQPLVFTWLTPMPVQGSAFRPGESVTIALSGPLNTPGVSPADIALGTVTADSQGAFSTALTIPYDRGITGPQAAIPRPGSYAVRATGALSGTVSAASRINLAPATYTGAGTTINWSLERGTRDGVLPGDLRAFSPERSDPEWISVWDNRPVEIYATVVDTGGDGAEQAAHISHEDDPLAHYAHDTNLFLVPDPQYRWTIGTANYIANTESDSDLELGRIELEWEVLNNGNTESYGTGRIGLPEWAIPTVDDRVYAVGRWVLDAGHPEIGDRTEMHPPRLLATMRQRPAVSNGLAAAQVDIYVSGHGGGANQYPSGMDALLNQNGRGGGRLRDVLSSDDQQLYRRAGPIGLLEIPLINLIVRGITGAALDAPIYGTAGPSAFSWGTRAPEQQPINDMDYDFDVPLPPQPAGASTVSVETITQPQHSTTVNEIITYPAPGLAHIHLPYRGADNGIYARTLKFRWNTASTPLDHFRVTLNRITVKTLPGEWHLWADVAGQWTDLRRLAPAFAQAAVGQTIAIPGAAFDVYLRDTDTLRVLVQGYRANCIDHLFGTLFGESSYAGGIDLLTTCGPINNDDLGGALAQIPDLPRSQTLRISSPSFDVDLTIDSLTTPPTRSDCQSRPALSPAITTGGIVGAGLSIPAVTAASPNALLTVFGQNFFPAGATRALTSPDIANGALPTNLGCTCVTVNNHLAPILYASPTAINFQAPASTLAGPAAVQVIANCAAPTEKTSAAQSITAQSATPEFFFFQLNPSGKNPIAATDAITGASIGATFPSAKPGEYVTLYATGLGFTDPPFASGQLATQAASTIAPVSVSLNGVPLSATDVLYSGVTPGFAGLYQINIHIPTTTPTGDIPVSLTINGLSTPPGAYLTIR